MMNDFENIPSESEFRNEMTVQPEEQDVSCGDLDENDEMVDNDDPNEQDTPFGEQLDQGANGVDDLGCEPDCGWPGDGSGMDDLADYNANEAYDYMNE
jgi:hypothetical protein